MLRNSRHIAIRVLCFLMLSLFFCSGALASRTAYVSCSALNVRKSASATSKKLGALPQGTKVKVLSVSGSWAKISYKGHTGYAATQYLSSSKSTSASGKRIKAYVTAQTGVYRYASTGSTRLGTAGKGRAVYVVGKSGSFYKVQNASGSRTGYILSSKLSRSKPANTVNSKAQRVVSMAKQQMGKPYALANAGPGSYDCSGLTSYCYRKVGVYLSRSAKAQGYNNGSKISKSQLKVGDIVCFNTENDDSDKSDHVGIYTGSGNFIHASSAAGKVVTSNLNSGYYARVFSWGRRVL